MNHPKELIEDIRNGKMVILVDDEDRENEGDLVLASDFISPEKINFMITEAKGLVCLALTDKQVDRLELHQMVPKHKNDSSNQTAFTVSIEAKAGVSTGISAADRAQTIRIAAHPNANPAELSTPGHIFPIRAQKGGVLKRAGHTEGSVDLAKLAGLNPAAVICEIMNPDGTMARVPDLKEFAKKHDLKIGTIVDLIKYRLQTESLVEEVAQNIIKDTLGSDINVSVFKDTLTDEEHMAFIVGDIKKDEVIPVRVQAQSIIDDIIGGQSLGQQKIFSCLQFFKKEKKGVLVYIQKNESLKTKVLLKDRTFDMDDKNFGVGAQILKKLNLKKVKLVTDSPKKLNSLKAFGVEVVDHISFSEITDLKVGASSTLNVEPKKQEELGLQR